MPASGAVRGPGFASAFLTVSPSRQQPPGSAPRFAYSAGRLECGWPWPALVATHTTSVPDTGEDSAPNLLPARWRGGIDVGFTRASAASTIPIALPWRPIWSGFLLNTLCYAAALLIAGVGVRAARRRAGSVCDAVRRRPIISGVIALLAAAYAASFIVGVQLSRYSAGKAYTLEMNSGSVIIERVDMWVSMASFVPQDGFMWDVQFLPRRYGDESSWYPAVRMSGGSWYIGMPLWVPAIGLLALAWLTHKRSDAGHCPCGYSRAGLAPGAACPECGRAP